MGGYNSYYFRFEVDTEKLTITLMPPKPRIFYGRKIKFFGECGGDLLLIQYSSPYVVGLNIHQMDTENCCWILKQRISFRPIEHAFLNERIREYNLLTVLKVSCEGKIIPVLAIEGKIIAYYPRRETYKVICYKVICYDDPDEFLRNEYLQWRVQNFESLSPV